MTLYYIIIRWNCSNGHAWQIARGTIEDEYGNFVLLDTDLGKLTVHRSVLHETYESALHEAQMKIAEEYGEEL